jgi:Na+/glutamate symporter
MLYPHDLQDVPRAIELLEAVVAVGKMDYGNMDANTCADMDALQLLGSVVKAILEPFTNVHMNLTEQITSLSTFAHLSFTLFRVSRTQYMSNQLYGDSQTMVKNAIFCLAKQQILDPTQPFYLFQVGDDPLKCLFGKLRMLGGHNTAMSYSQAIDRLGHASDLQGAFMRNPDLD